MTNVPSLIFLIGFMGAGKTTVGRVLARKLDYSFVDLDHVIEEQQGRSVRDIFFDSGEAEFRRLEKEAVKSCGALGAAIVALGGGAYGSRENRSFIRSIGKVVWLDCPLDTCLSRIADDASRPLLRSRDEMEAMLAERRPYYAQADFVVDSQSNSADEIADAIVASLKVR